MNSQTTSNQKRTKWAAQEPPRTLHQLKLKKGNSFQKRTDFRQRRNEVYCNIGCEEAPVGIDKDKILTFNHDCICNKVFYDNKNAIQADYVESVLKVRKRAADKLLHWQEFINSDLSISFSQKCVDAEHPALAVLEKWHMPFCNFNFQLLWNAMCECDKAAVGCKTQRMNLLSKHIRKNGWPALDHFLIYLFYYKQNVRQQTLYNFYVERVQTEPTGKCFWVKQLNEFRKARQVYLCSKNHSKFSKIVQMRDLCNQLWQCYDIFVSTPMPRDSNVQKFIQLYRKMEFRHNKLHQHNRKYHRSNLIAHNRERTRVDSKKSGERVRNKSQLMQAQCTSLV